MSDPEMRPDELAWAFQNAGRAPPARQTTSEEFAARSRAGEQQAVAQQDLDRRLFAQQHAQDMQYNQAIHGQDMAAAQANHQALMGQYALVDQVRGELGAMNVSSFDWKQGFVVGLALGALAVGLFGNWGKKRR